MNVRVHIREGGLITPSLFRRRRNALLDRHKGPDWRRLLLDLTDAVRTSVHRARNAGLIEQRNAKGDIRHAMDLAAQDAVKHTLQQANLPLRLYSEENDAATHIDFGAFPPRWQIIVDPLDGTDNAARGLPLSAFTAAILPLEASLSPLNVIAAAIAPLPDTETERPFLLIDASMGMASLAPISRITDALITVELNHYEPQGTFASLLKHARGVRCYGCCSRALALMLSGATHAHIDIRGRLTPESWLAASAMILHAGGAVFIADENLSPTSAPSNLLDRRSLVAAATPELLNTILALLKTDET